MSNPEYVKVDNELYRINTDFRVAIEANCIAQEKSIGDLERALAIIFKLFGEEGLNCKNQNKLLELGTKYLMLGKEKENVKNSTERKYELDFSKCEGLIKSSFKYDYKYDPYELEYLHWYDFYNDLENLSSSEFGNCCVFNRVVSILDMDVSKIKDNKERTKIIEAKELLRNRYCTEERIEMTKEQEESAREFYKSIGIDL